MSGDSTIAAKLAFNGIDKDTLAVLAENKSFILGVLPKILERFYEHVFKFDETRRLFKNRDHMEHAKRMQLQHWSFVADGRFDQNYEASVTKIGETHHRIGLEPRWYIGGYNFVVSGLVEAVALGLPARKLDASAATRKLKLQQAIIKAAMLDMQIAIDVYSEAARRERHTTLDRLAGDFEKAVGGVAGAVSSAATQLETAARTMTAGAQEAAKQSDRVAKASEGASAHVQSVAAATEELTSSVAEIARQVNHSEQIAKEAVSNAKDSGDRVHELAEGAQKIGAVIELINTIASQTNLLALNATIEAARAGEAGKGFAVVAQEVKALAAQTAKATEEISGQITNIQSATADSVAAIGKITTVINSMSEVATTIASAVEEQRAATQEIARNIGQASEGTREVSSNIAGVSRSVGHTGTAAAQVLTSAKGLADMAAQLRAEADKFLATVRAA